MRNNDPTQPRRLRTSLRLKAARYLTGNAVTDGKRPRAVPLPVAQLAAHQILRENGITQNRLEEIEQMSTDARPMELERIAEALGLPPAFFTEDAGLAARVAALEDASTAGTGDRDALAQEIESLSVALETRLETFAEQVLEQLRLLRPLEDHPGEGGGPTP